MSTRSRRASNASDTSQEASQAVDGAALGAQLAALSAAVKEIADQQSNDREAAKALEAERAASHLETATLVAGSPGNGHPGPKWPHTPETAIPVGGLAGNRHTTERHRIDPFECCVLR